MRYRETRAVMVTARRATAAYLRPWRVLAGATALLVGLLLTARAVTGWQLQLRWADPSCRVARSHLGISRWDEGTVLRHRCM
jgi:hypothetical protein